jgi:hypothetical protein
MGLFKKLKSKTPKKDKVKGQVATTIGTVCGAILATGLVANPIGVIALTVGAIVFGGKAVYHGIQTEEDETSDEKPEEDATI